MLILTLRPDLQAEAVELEHETFRNAKVANLYKASVLKKVGPGQEWVGHAQGRAWERAAPPHCRPSGCRQRRIHPPPGKPLMSGEPDFHPLPAGGLLDNPVRTRTCPVASNHRPQKPTCGKPGLGIIRS